MGQEKSIVRGKWNDMVWPGSTSANYNPDTGVDEAALVEVGRASVQATDGFVSTSSSLPYRAEIGAGNA